MRGKHFLADLFEPDTWGLRGDNRLWRAMKALFAKEPIPSTMEELPGQIAAAFMRLTGHSLDTLDPFYVEGFAHGGMSSGYIFPEWWRNGAVPRLASTLRHIQARSSDKPTMKDPS